VPEIIDQVFAKTSPKRSFSMTEYERFGLVFTKTRVYKFGHGGRGGGVSYSLGINKSVIVLITLPVKQLKYSCLYVRRWLRRC
jgi:hypothetical protein